jgi:hypothetical protein
MNFISVVYLFIYSNTSKRFKIDRFLSHRELKLKVIITMYLPLQKVQHNSIMHQRRFSYIFLFDSDPFPR